MNSLNLNSNFWFAGKHDYVYSSCCASRFTWASTSDTEAQEARDKHNCRSCGGLVCDPCSSNRVPISDVGINMPSRVCDRCYHDMGAALTDNNALTRSFMEDSDDDNILRPEEEDDENQENGNNTKPKRSTVVDELIQRMPSTTVSS